MINEVQLLNIISNLNNTSLNSNNNSDSGSFDMVMATLLRAVSQKNQYDLLNNVPMNNQNLQNLDSENILQNIGRVEVETKNGDEKTRIENAIKISSQKYGVDENLIKAIIKVESNFNPKVESSAGAKGLMQLMPENCKALNVQDPFNIEQNIDGGTRHIKEYLDRYNGNVEMALMAYNGGPTRMMRRGVNSIQDIYKMPKETQNYVPKVMKYYRG
ncbi:MAG: lytic transglycosylase domain-containing protein [Cetobacterium sp.]